MDTTKQSYILPARRAQWLVSAMSYAYGLNQPMQNEVVVLATGLDQYLQELFHHLDFAGNECVSRKHFLKLLQVLGLRNCEDVFEKDVDTSNGTMDFKEFHRQLVQSFLEENGEVGLMEGKRWGFEGEGELVEAEVHMAPRQGHSVRTMCSECFCEKPVSEIFHSVLYKQGKLADGDDGKDLVNVESNVLQQQAMSAHVVRLQEENEGLRELIEDMRQALQSSDAKNLALEVTLSNLRSADKSPHSNFVAGIPNGNLARPKYLTLLTNEFNRLQDKRNVQLEEAMLYTQELEADLWRSRKDREILHKAKANLLQNQQSVTVQLEKAREVLSAGLQRVKLLEEQASQVEQLQRRLQEVQSAFSGDDGCCRRQCCSPLRQKNHLIANKAAHNHDHGVSVTSPERNRNSPTRISYTHLENCTSSDTDDHEQMVRAVEGQEASDEETETQKESSPICNPENHENGTDTMRRAKLSEIQAKMDKMRKQLQDMSKEKEDMKTKLEQERSHILSQLEQKTKVTDKFKREIQHLESERVRLSLVENKIRESIVLLQKLKELHLSRRSVGKIIMDSLEISLRDNGMNMDPGDDVTRFLACFQKQLQQQYLLLETKTTTNGPSNSYVSHNAVHMSSRKTMSSTTSSSSETHSRSSNSIQVKTNFYQFGSIKAGMKGNLPATFRAIKTDLGTV
ncbi:EF-hand and coiled-coil domain-containing protein 1-like [Amphiura filiformis]|uniref:EF-hand and coiled-coil domain-containing protein 1-like n=1 Tax=Amphiura filiformis TaxID=82378 RepID=UPI003B2157CE